MSKLNKDIDDLFGVDKNDKSDKVAIKQVFKKPNARPGGFSSILMKKTQMLLPIAAILAVGYATALYADHHRTEELKLRNKTTQDHINDYVKKLDLEGQTTYQETKGGKNFNVIRDAFGNNIIVGDTPEPTKPEVKPEVKEPTIQGTYLKDKNIRVDIERVTTSIDIPSNLKNNQVSAHMIKTLSQQPEFKTDFNAVLLAATLNREGFVSHVYNDVGFASIGPGQTMGVQSAKSTKEKFSSIGLSDEKVKFFTGLSNKRLSEVQLPKNYKEITITGQEGGQLALLQIHNSFIPSVKNSVGTTNYNNLLVQQKIALIGLSYQKGTVGQTTSNAVKVHSSWLNKNPNATEEQRVQNWANNVTPTYSMVYNIEKDGKKIKVTDTRALIMAKMMSDNYELAIKQMNNTITPKEFKEFSAVAKSTMPALKDVEVIKVNKSLFGDDTVEMQDPIKELKAQAENGEIKMSVQREKENKPKYTSNYPDVKPSLIRTPGV